jgi:hypothetical protein
MAEDTGYLCLSATTDFPVYTLHEIQYAPDELPSPALITNTVVPKRSPCERGVRFCALADETASSVGVEAEDKWNEQVMCIPEGFI